MKNEKIYSKILFEPIGEITEIFSTRELTDIEWKIKELELRQKHIMEKIKIYDEKLSYYDYFKE